jgi:DNA topoisomerase-1
MDVKFTSFMEDELDKIEDAHLDWVRVLHEFYDPFRDRPVAGRRGDGDRPQPAQRAQVPAVRRRDGLSLEQGRPLPGVQRTTRAASGTLNVDRNGEPIVPKTTEHMCEQCGSPMVNCGSRAPGTSSGAAAIPMPQHDRRATPRASR